MSDKNLREAYPYTAAWHIFNTGFPCRFKRMDVMPLETAHRFGWTVPLTAEPYTKEDYLQESTTGSLTIAQMTEMLYSRKNFDLRYPSQYVLDIRHLLGKHLHDWDGEVSFVGAMQVDLEGLEAMRKLLSVMEKISWDAHAGYRVIAYSEFAASLDFMSTQSTLLKPGKTFNDALGIIPEERQQTSDKQAAVEAVASGRNVFLESLLDD